MDASAEAQLKAESREIERLLGEIQELVPADAWQRIERVIRCVVRLYGTGLEHAVEHAHTAGAAREAFQELLAGDDLVANLLALRGAHPLPVETRVRRALERVKSELGLPDDALALVEIRDGIAVVCAAPGRGGGPLAAHVAKAAITKAIESAAPELRGIEITTDLDRRTG